ncbi:MAG: hypothetical protein JW719_08610 [Pirellulales bacterium]|nr:hypothetical protein [Pirellulales bacterium]
MPRNGSLRAMLCAALAAASLLLVGATREELNQRRQRIEQMPPAQKAELARKYERFSRMPREKQDQLRRLHKRLQENDDGPALREVMWLYCDWLGTLFLGERNDLESLPIDQRVAKIKEKRYRGQDARAIREWSKVHFQRLGLTRQKLFEELMNEIHSRGGRGQGRPRERNSEPSLLVRLFRLEDADFSTLRDRLSPATRERFDKLSPKEQRNWVALALRDVSRPRPPSSAVTDEQLAEYLKSDLISSEDREELMRLPGDEMYKRLLRMYRAAHAPRFQPGGPGRRGPWPSRSGRFTPRGEPGERGDQRGGDREPFQGPGLSDLRPDQPPPPTGIAAPP